MADAATRCLNCGAEVTGAHCPACGQKARTGRLTVPQLLRAALEAALELDSPPLRTMWELTWRPGHVCAAYIAGQRRRYTNPVKYALIMGAIAVVLMEIFDIRMGEIVAPASATASPGQEQVRVLVDWLQRYTQAATLLTMPLLAVLLRLFFIWVDRNIAEHLVLCLYVYGHNYLIQAILIPLGGYSSQVGALALTGVAFIYLSWAAVRATGLKWYIAAPLSLLAHLTFQGALMVAFVVAMFSM